jgi:hypothetical protein
MARVVALKRGRIAVVLTGLAAAGLLAARGTPLWQAFGNPEPPAAGPSTSEAITSPSADTAGSTRSVLRLQHAFGLVKNGASLEHKFAVRNDTDIPWTIKKIITNCSCTVPSVSGSKFPPGETSMVTVAYHAPNRTVDESRAVTVEFEEPSAPQLALVITANVREPLSVSKSDVSLTAMAGGPSPSGALTVQNYSESDWSSIKVSSDHAWLSASVTDVASDSPPDRLPKPRQRWSVALKANPAGKPPGRYFTQLRVIGLQAESCVAETAVPVNFTVTLPVTPHPDELFLGNIEGKHSLERTVVFRFTAGTVRPRSDRVALEHDLAAALIVTWDYAGETGLVAAVKITPRAGMPAGPHSGRVRFIFPIGPTTQAVDIPVRFRNG